MQYITNMLLYVVFIYLLIFFYTMCKIYKYMFFFNLKITLTLHKIYTFLYYTTYTYPTCISQALYTCITFVCN